MFLYYHVNIYITFECEIPYKENILLIPYVWNIIILMYHNSCIWEYFVNFPPCDSRSNKEYIETFRSSIQAPCIILLRCVHHHLESSQATWQKSWLTILSSERKVIEEIILRDRERERCIHIVDGHYLLTLKDKERDMVWRIPNKTKVGATQVQCCFAKGNKVIWLTFTFWMVIK